MLLSSLTCSISTYSQPILADEVQSFKALITVHKVLQEGHPVAVREAQNNTNWLDSLTRGVSGEGLRGTESMRCFSTNACITGARQQIVYGKLTICVGYGPLLREYVYFLLAKLAFHRQHPEFNGTVPLRYHRPRAD